ncbi:enoyl-CoA hydratase [Myxococcota bacterium]|nr:enoyl-CoA hydratase [Myxococcota bacterium]
MSGKVFAHKDGAVGWIVFDHPDRRNAISSHMWSELRDAATLHAGDDDVRVVVMRGAGDEAFVSGADISQFPGNPSAADSPAQTPSAPLRTGGGDVFDRLAELDKPLVAMIHGHCVGGGVLIALAADIRYASATARFSIPAARLGIGYDVAAVESLAGVVGYPQAKEILFSARTYDAEDALRIGLLNRVVPGPDLEQTVNELASQIASNAPLTIRAIKRAAAELNREPSRRDLSSARADVQSCFESDDFREGVRAFMQKRDPVFRGR